MAELWPGNRPGQRVDATPVEWVAQIQSATVRAPSSHRPLSQRPLRLTLAVVAVVVPALAAAQPSPRPLTVAESSGFTATSRLSDVMAFVRDLQRESPKVRVATLCTSAEGRTVPMLIVGDPAPASPEDLRGDDRAVVYLQANIHGGEVEGKDAALMLVRDIVQGRTPNVLDRLVLLVVPVFNTDGNERISTANRTNQNGPVQGVGVRPNGQNLDLNRDAMKVESPEVDGLLDVLNRWDPVFFLDSHTHNGSYHQEPATWTWGLNPNGDPAILDYMAGTLWPAIARTMRETHGTLVIPHGDFVDPRAPETGWIPLDPQPRYLSNYVGLRNRFSVLNEQYPYADFETRVRTGYQLLRSFVEYVHAHRDEMVRMAREADRRALARGRAPRANDGFIVETNQEPVAARITVQGYEMEVTEGPGGYPRVKPTERKRTYADLPYLAKFTSKRSVRLPRGYVIDADPAIVAKLRQHGIAVERLAEAATLPVEGFRITALTPSAQLNQGHYTNAAKGEYFEETRTFPAGALFVSTSQRLGALAAALLEPESDDGLLVWNFFDRVVSVQWGRGPREYPVFRVHGEPPARRDLAASSDH